MRIPIILAIAALALASCDAIKTSIPRRRALRRSSPGATRTPILTIPSATPRTTPGGAAAATKGREGQRPAASRGAVGPARALAGSSTQCGLDGPFEHPLRKGE